MRYAKLALLVLPLSLGTVDVPPQTAVASARTGQLWRDVAEVVVPRPAAAEPLVMLRRESIYGPSRFGILVPERIVWDWVTHFSHPRNGQPSFTLSERTTFTYSAFRRFDVATEERMKTPDARERSIARRGTIAGDETTENTGPSEHTDPIRVIRVVRGPVNRLIRVVRVPWRSA